MTTLKEIESQARVYAEAREKLAEIVTALNDGIEALKREHMPSLKRAVGTATKRHDELKALIEDTPGLFVKPRTVTVHGVRVGYAKGKGGIDYDDPAQVVKLIRKHFPDQADVLIAVKETPAKKALSQLSAADLRRIGCTVRDSGDQVVIHPADSEVDKLVDALMADATREVEVA